MFYSGSNLLVKLYGGPYPYPRVTSTFKFPVMKLEVAIEKGELRYMTGEGGKSLANPKGFCWDDTNKKYDHSIESEEKCNDAGFVWSPYVSATSVNHVQSVQLNNMHLTMALDLMLKYYEEMNVNRQDYLALSEWVADVQNQASLNKTWSPNAQQQSEILDCVAIQFESQQASSPIYNPGSQYMDTQMRGNTLVNGVISLNYNSERNVDLLGFDPTGEINLEVIYNRDEFELNDNLEGFQYDYETESRGYYIENVEFISRSHSASPASENIVENYQFIAKEIKLK